jgi:hypothetical protein
LKKKIDREIGEQRKNRQGKKEKKRTSGLRGSFSANKSILFRNRMMLVLTNQRLLQIESKSVSASCMRFCVSLDQRIVK